MHIHFDLPRHLTFAKTYGWALLLSLLVVAVTATLARATMNLAAALVEKPDIAVLLLLPDEGITRAKLLRTLPDERDYLLETKNGSEMARLKRGQEQWYVAEVVPLHGGEGEAQE